jgi:hypothetical protein
MVARACLSRLLKSAWTVRDVRDVLTFGHPHMFGAIQAIDDAMTKRGAGTYVPLASAILVGALIGNAPDSSTFDEAA